MQKEFEEDMRRLNEIQNKTELLYNQQKEIEINLNKYNMELQEQE